MFQARLISFDEVDSGGLVAGNSFMTRQGIL
jgi:hypothetical protein